MERAMPVRLGCLSSFGFSQRIVYVGSILFQVAFIINGLSRLLDLYMEAIDSDDSSVVDLSLDTGREGNGNGNATTNGDIRGEFRSSLR